MRILIYRLGSLGDTVLALPSFHLIRETYPDASITVLTNAPVSGKAAPLESILDSSGLIDAVIHYPVGLRDPRKLFELVRRLRAGKFDLLVSLAGARGFAASLRDLLFFKACGIPKIVGIPFQHRDLVCVRRPDGVLFESEVDRLLRRISSLGRIDLAHGKWIDLRLTPMEKAEATRLLAANSIDGKFIAASLGTKSPLKDWGTPSWSELLARLSQAHPTRGLILLGSADEFERSAALLKNWRGPAANFCGVTSPRVSAALLEKAAMFVGHDSGPMHLAAAAGVRCVALFSAHAPPGQWFPLGHSHEILYPTSFFDPQRVNDLAHQRAALASIQVDDVLKAAAAILDDGTFGNSPTN
jgi:ADP-heptose:LPS heptosyltransferase